MIELDPADFRKPVIKTSVDSTSPFPVKGPALGEYVRQQTAMTQPQPNKPNMRLQIIRAMEEHFNVDYNKLSAGLEAAILKHCIDKPSIVIRLPNQVVENWLTTWVQTQALNKRTITLSDLGRVMEIFWWHERAIITAVNYTISPAGALQYNSGI